MNNSPNHYNGLVALVESGTFDFEPQGRYLRDIIHRAEHIHSPIGANSIFEAFGLSRRDFDDCINSYVKKALVRDNVLPLDYLVAVEDEVSVVFIENHPEIERSLKLTSFRDVQEGERPYIGAIYGASLQFIGLPNEYFIFETLDLFGALVIDCNLERVPLSAMPALTQDLTSDVVTVIEQLAYMDMKGLLPNKDV